MFFLSFLAATASLLPSSGLASPIGGRTLSPEELPPFLCELSFKEGRERGECSAALISPTEVVTALHCLISDRKELFTPIKKLRIQCGTQTFHVRSAKKDDATALLIKRLMSEKNTVKLQNHSVNHDIAVLTLDRASDRTAVSVLTPEETRERFFSDGELKKDVQCRFAGNARGPLSADLEIGGKSDYRLAFIPDEENALAHAPRTFPVDQDQFRVSGFFDHAKAYPEEGDSGGPLYCRLKADSQWTLVGVLSMAKYGFAGSQSYTISKFAFLGGWTR